MGLFGINIAKSYPFFLRDTFVTGMMGKLSPEWLSLKQMESLNEVYQNNPVLYAVINLKANYFSNLKIVVRDLKTEEIFTKERLIKDDAPALVKKMLRIAYNPNPLQSKDEFLKQNCMSHNLYGNSFLYGNFASSKRYDIETLDSLKNVWAYRMEPILTGRYFSARKESDIISGWKFKQIDGKNQIFKPEEILHRKEPNLILNESNDVVFGMSKAIPLARPLSTIMVNYEALNIIGRERGMRAIISSEKDDAQLGKSPMKQKEKDEVQKELREYGFLEGQNQFMVTRHPVRVVQMDQDIRKLALQEQIASDTMIVCNVLGVPVLLVKLYVQGATYENLDASERQMYQNTTIPEAQDWIDDINDWLKTKDYGFEYNISFDHIKVLQQNEKERSIIDRNKTISLRDSFMAGLITYNQWLKEMKMDTRTDEYANKYIYELTPEIIQYITGRNTDLANVERRTNNNE